MVGGGGGRHPPGPHGTGSTGLVAVGGGRIGQSVVMHWHGLGRHGGHSAPGGQGGQSGGGIGAHGGQITHVWLEVGVGLGGVVTGGGVSVGVMVGGRGVAVTVVSVAVGLGGLHVRVMHGGQGGGGGQGVQTIPSQGGQGGGGRQPGQTTQRTGVVVIGVGVTTVVVGFVVMDGQEVTQGPMGSGPVLGGQRRVQVPSIGETGAGMAFTAWSTPRTTTRPRNMDMVGFHEGMSTGCRPWG
ncbi:hypothetical protein CC1G_14561 [Coprinopsis cinerea okayama7|uniref:Uncharacterized protein n=1 Tax=Coprinopsis cinerea (strain Okayama-7 / 130 / ATCC MYA-4618 / FGSC 9003) TaxID=240176 RepID=D6RMN3_COPC7|nr:hypothetical protein CC1G_14561 [Coprinopsis cinerea okayama7\|eukprot:XP_002911129.1 hypothetical protein CC1G_14561 [Coprinopsis cinerea okayama7\